jgi:hypothetical protein
MRAIFWRRTRLRLLHLAKHLPGATFRTQPDLASLLFGVSVLGLRLQ